MKSTRDIFIATSALRRKSAWLPALTLALALPAMTRAATQYWDTGTASGYQVGNGDWGTSSDWTINGTTLETWTNANTGDFNGSGIAVVTVNSAVAAGAVYLGITPGNGVNSTVFLSGSSTLTDTSYFGVGWQNNGNSDTVFDTFIQTGGTINITASGIIIGRFGATGSYYMSSGNLTTPNAANSIRLGNVASATGNYGNSSGTFVIDGGTVNAGASGQIILGATGNASGGNGSGVLSLNSGSLTASNLTMAVTATYTSGTLDLNNTGSGSTLTLSLITNTAGTGTFNFNGGTLKPAGASATFMTNLTGAYIYAGGAVIDTSSATGANTIGQNLLVPSGGGYGLPMTALTPSTAGVGYKSAPAVAFGAPASGTDAATGYVVLNTDGTINKIVITSPGSGYSSSQSVSVTLSGGSPTTAATFASATANASQAGGGLTKLGANTLTLSGANTYTGNTIIKGGTLALGSSGSINNSSTIQITNGASFDVSAISTYTLSGSTTLRASGTTGSPATIKAGTSIALGSQAVTLDFNPTSTSGDITSPALTIASGNLTLNGQISIKVGGATPLGIGTYTLVSNLSGTISGSPTFVTSGPGTTGIAANTTVSLDLTTPGQLNLVVQASPTTMTLTRTQGGSPSTYGDTLIFQATLSPDLGDGTVVTFLTNGVAFGTATTLGGNAYLTNTTLPYSVGSSYVVTAAATGSSAGLLSGGQQVNQYGLTISGATAQNKLVDGTTAAVITGGTLSGTVNGDVITANTGTFAQTSAGTGIAVTINLSGAAAGNYSLAQPVPGLTANIYAYPTWINPLGGLWDTAGNWGAGTIASGSTNTADFSQLDITADTTVSLNSSWTIRNLIFGDTNTTSAAGWVLDNNANPVNTLTLAGTTPTITVSNLAAGKSVTISATVAGTSGLTKAGSGTLILSGSNIVSGTLTIAAGTLQVANSSALMSGNPVTLSNSGIFDVETNVTIGTLTAGSGNTNVNTTLGNGCTLTITNLPAGSSDIYYGKLTGQGGITLNGAANGTFYCYSTSNTYSGNTTITSGRLEVNGAGVLSPNTSVIVNGNSSVGGQFFDNANETLANNFTISGVGYPDTSVRFGAIRLGNAGAGPTLSGIITLTANSRIGVHNGATAAVSGQITETGGQYGIDFYGTDNKANAVNVITISSQANNYSGNTTIYNLDYSTGNSGSTTLKLGASEVIPNGSGKGILVFNGADANHLTILELNGFSETINGLSDAAGSGAVVQNTATGSSILTIGDANTNSSFDGTITDGGTGSGKYLALTKIGSGTLTLAANNYQGNTTVNGGTLSLGQPTLSTNSTVSITNGAVLQLAFAGGQTNTVTALVLNGTNQPAGLYGSTTPGGYLAGSLGKLLVAPPVTINPNPPVLQVSSGAGSLSIAWPTNQGWILQTNSVGLTATNAWFNYPPDGLVNATNVTITVDSTKANVFYRMVYP